MGLKRQITVDALFQMNCHFSHDAMHIKSQISASPLCTCALSIFITLYNHGETHSLHIVSALCWTACNSYMQRILFCQWTIRLSSLFPPQPLGIQWMKNNTRCTHVMSHTVWRKYLFLRTVPSVECNGSLNPFSYGALRNLYTKSGCRVVKAFI